MEKFNGNDDITAKSIQQGKSIEVVDCLDRWEVLLKNRVQDETKHAQIGLSALGAPALAALSERYRPLNVTGWTWQQFRDALLSLVPKVDIECTMNMFACEFKADSLQNDSNRFAQFCQLSLATHPKFVRFLIRQKLERAVPGILADQQTQHGHTLPEAGDLDSALNQMKEIVTSFLQDQANQRPWTEVTRKRQWGTGLVSQQKKKDDTKPSGAASPSNSRNPSQQPRGRSGNPRLSSYQKDVGMRNPENQQRNKELAQMYGRCFECGELPLNGDWTAHRAVCPKDPRTFARVMGNVAKDHDAQRDPNRPGSVSMLNQMRLEESRGAQSETGGQQSRK